MIAVVLALIISGVAFKVSSQSKYFLSLSKKRENFYYKASVAALAKEGKNAYEMLKDFDIKNDRIIHSLKKDRFEKKVSTDYSLEENIGDNKINVTLNKIKIFNKTNSLILYSPGVK